MTQSRMPLPTFHSRAFTLVELLITTSIASIVLFSAYLCLRAGLITQKDLESRSNIIQSGRVALDIISADLRSATPLHADFEFIGLSRSIGSKEADNLDFATHHFTPKRPGESDFCEVSYFLDMNEDTGTLSLWRRRDGTRDPEPLAGGLREELVQDVHGLKLEYYDGFDWYDNWGSTEEKTGEEDDLFYNPNLYGLPEAVRITLTFEVQPKRETNLQQPLINTGETEEETHQLMTFQTIVHLNLAAALWESTYGTGSSSGSTGGNGGTPGGTP